jgi:hypothetical protein
MSHLAGSIPIATNEYSGLVKGGGNVNIATDARLSVNTNNIPSGPVIGITNNILQIIEHIIMHYLLFYLRIYIHLH